MKITQVRNATIIIEYNNTKFLIDPWLAPKNSMPGFDTAINSEIRQPRVELPFEIEKIVNTDAVIITHVHPDHWDEYAENAIRKDMKIFVQSETDKKFIISRGFRNVEILTQDGNLCGKIKLFKTGCQHGRREILKPLCDQIGMPYDSMGVVFKSDEEKTLYIAGDTIYCQEVQDALDKFTPEVVVVNACGATVLNGERLIMKEDDLDELFKHAPYAIVIASHMDTVSHLSITRKDLKEYAKKNNIKNLLIPDDGETLTFTRSST